MDLFRGREEFSVDEVRFDLAGGCYRGPGVLEWAPETGARLLAFPTRSGPPLQKHIRIPDDLGLEATSLRVRLGGGWGRMRIPVRMSANSIILRWDNRLDVRLGRVVASRRSDPRWATKASWSGRSVFWLGTDGRTMLPDSVRSITWVGQQRTEALSRSALSVGDRVGARWTGRTTDGFLHLGWALRPRYARLGRWWRWPEAFALSLTLLLGRQVSLVQSEEEAPHRERLLLQRRPEELVKLGILAPFQNTWVPKDDLVNVTRLMYGLSIKGLVARKMTEQLLEAARQATHAGLELLTATILEAAMRTLNDIPYVPNARNQFNVSRELRHFCAEHLSQRWTSYADEVIVPTWRRVRHRNAHPEWLTGSPRPTSLPRQARRDLTTLARFYGAMILGMAGRAPAAPPSG